MGLDPIRAAKNPTPFSASLTSTVVREHLPNMYNLDTTLLITEGLPHGIAKSLSDVDKHLLPESYKDQIRNFETYKSTVILQFKVLFSFYALFAFIVQCYPHLVSCHGSGSV
jgi:hypothetical protein